MKLSPDGGRVAWIAPRDGAMNVWVAPVDDLAAAKPVTRERTRPIRQHLWSPDGGWIVTVGAADAVGATWLYEREAKRLTKLYDSRPELAGPPLIEIHPREIRATCASRAGSMPPSG